MRSLEVGDVAVVTEGGHPNPAVIARIGEVYTILDIAVGAGGQQLYRVDGEWLEYENLHRLDPWRNPTKTMRHENAGG